MSRELNKQFQRALIEQGYDLPEFGADGYLGAETAEAYALFLSDSGMPMDVEVDGDVILASGPVAETSSDLSNHPLPWMAVAYDHAGLHEVHDNAELKRFLRSDGATIGDPSQFAWCADFTQTCIKIALPDEPFTGRVAENPYLAYNWGTDFGREVEPCVGALLDFWRGSPDSIYGHIGFYIGEDDTHYYVLGGNTKDSVSIARIEKRRLRASMWPLSTDIEPGGPKRMDDPEIALSVNEA